jgi:hypothetical protein
MEASLFDPSNRNARADIGRSLGWAAYLGMSWTWCIGMFLPVLLIRDFGAVGWLVFAVPNVLGAAAMGWAIRSRDHSLQLIVRHRHAARIFSLVTIAFHFYFMLWMVPQVAGPVAAVVGLGLMLAVCVPLLASDLQQTLLATVVLIASLAIGLAMSGLSALSIPALLPPMSTSMPGAFDVLSLSVVCLLGFLTCPYLDLTFHRARQACGVSESKIAFGVGFGVIFCSMIVLTAGYAATLGGFSRGVGAVLAGHWILQSLFTVGAHASALRGDIDSPAADRRMTRHVLIAILVGVAAALAGSWMERRQIRIGSHVAGESLYRSFLAFYGLLAPAYVWLCVHPGRGFLAPHSREIQMFVLASVLAVPLYAVGFLVDGQMRWALLGAGIVVGARFLLDYTRRDFLAEQRSAMKTPAVPPPED